MPDYKQGKIYQIVNDVNDIVYVGSTIQPLHLRFSGHKTSVKLGDTSPFWSAMREIGCEHFKIILIKAYQCENRQELLREEYATMLEFKKNGFKLYNSVVDGRMSAASREKISKAHMGKQHRLNKPTSDEAKRKISIGNIRIKDEYLKHGYISYIPRANAWKFSWQANDKKRMKSFACKKYGFWKARFLTEQERKRVYPEWKTSEEIAIEELCMIEY